MTLSPRCKILVLLSCILVARVNSFSAINTKGGGIQDILSRNKNYNIEVLSEDPKCFIIRDFLSEEECKAYISRADNADASLMTQSNAPQATLQMSRLWPLPFLSLAAGIPPIIRLYENSPDVSSIGSAEMFAVASQPIGAAIGVMCSLLFLVTNIMQKYAGTTRTSESLALNREEDCEFITNLVNRASAVTGRNWKNWEAPVITRYSMDAIFASHNDASPTRGSEWKDLGGQRMTTVITYLNTCSEGGATKFDKLGFQVQPERGSALVFYPADENLDADERTIHQSLPAVDEKYIVQLFGRYERVPPPLGIPDSFGSL
ncbi:hypothetical protein CTEN210_07696 [Chaetoceros tenuissimus]|uniref:Prolyl 4-hydroxylase alpha subunit domain-containing protein n=1 Tax=Chaetoceros tenuissimus TaxID=426638 RepID=A0AAD3CUC9_9STRA|nr:hypothetical protein CTEN210_07696 [Chaetoceros tenuissimus]